ncbi:MAG TPA: Na+-dependent transporter [Bradyrhizobium sp.]|nr:Na+-dependent transporter [Bradyrhizobium sp.]
MLASAKTIAAAPVRALLWLGGQGTRAIAALVFIGIAVPSAGALLKPYVTEAIFVLLCASFLRVDLTLLRDYLRRPRLVFAATAWTMLAVPAMTGAAWSFAGLDRISPDLYLALMLQAVASPMMASPALAAVMGLDSTLVLVTLVISTGLVPLTAPLFAFAFLGTALTLSPLMLGLKLLAILTGALLVASAIRWSMGGEAIKRHARMIDGITILFLFVFVSAVMGNVAGGFLSDPIRAVKLTLLAFVVFLALMGVTAMTFRKAGHARAMALGLMVAQRNMGLMLAATDGVLPGTTWLYFAFSQFPIYLSPQLLKPIVRRLGGP